MQSPRQILRYVFLLGESSWYNESGLEIDGQGVSVLYHPAIVPTTRPPHIHPSIQMTRTKEEGKKKVAKLARKSATTSAPSRYISYNLVYETSLATPKSINTHHPSIQPSIYLLIILVSTQLILLSLGLITNAVLRLHRYLRAIYCNLLEELNKSNSRVCFRHVLNHAVITHT